MAISPNEQLAHYRLLERIGQGGMGEVWRALDTSLSREVAIKLVRSSFGENPELRARFEREARLLASLNHPNIATVYALQEDRGVRFLAMELVPGRDLSEWLSGGGMGLDEALKIARQVAQGLAAAHKRGVVHRDLKPSNIRVTPEGDVKVLDFGMAKALQVDAGTVCDDESATMPTLAYTRPGALLGTPGYMSPEQARGELADQRADVWAFGCVLYELLTSRAVFKAGSLAETLAATLTAEPDWKAIPEAVSPAVVELLRGCLSKSAERRPSDLTEAERVLGCLEGAVLPAGGGMSRPSPDPRGGKSLVVLPFNNLTADPEIEYFSDGLTEDLINALSRFRDLRIAARTSSFVFKGKDPNVRSIREKLQVDTALQGSVRISGERLRITAEVVDLTNGFLLWSDRYDRRIDDVFVIQDEITNAIVESLELTLWRAPRSSAMGPGAHFDAYNECLKARYCLNRRTKHDLLKSVRLFESALELDPDCVGAHSGLADSYNMLGSGDYAVLPPEEAFPKAREAAARALELDPSLAEAHTAMGWVGTVYDWDWEPAEQHYLRSLELNPGYATTHHWYGIHLVLRGKLPEAEQEVQAARQLDPLSPIVNCDVAWVLHRSRRYEEAVRQARHTLELAPDFSAAHWNLAQSLRESGDIGGAIEEFEVALRLSPSNLVFEASLAHALATAGETERATGILERFQSAAAPDYVPPHAMVLIHLGLGNHDEALDWLEEANRARSDFVIEARVDPVMDPVRSDPRFKELMGRLQIT